MSQKNTGVFEGCETFLTLRDYPTTATQPWLAIQRDHSQMCRTQFSNIHNCENLPYLGWQLQSHHLNPGDAVWLTAAQAGNITVAGGASAAPHIEQVNAFSQQSISGVTYSGDVQSLGFPLNVPRPGPTTDWSTIKLFGDQDAYPPPFMGADYTPMQRQYYADVPLGTNLTFYILAPSSSITPRGSLGTLYFNGPAGDAPPVYTGTNLPGCGQYALKLRGDGLATLSERTIATSGSPMGVWISRYSFMWNFQANTSVSWVLIAISVNVRMWQDINGNWAGDRITFSQSSGAQTPGQLALIQNNSELASRQLRFQRGSVSVYNPPRATLRPTAIAPVRMDLAVDCRAPFGVSKHIYETSGTITDDFVSFDQPVTQSRNISLVWSGVLPAGCSWSPLLFDNNNNPLAMVGGVNTVTTAQGQTSQAFFRPTVNMVGAQAQFNFNGLVSGLSTPLLERWSMYAAPIYSTPNIESITIPRRSEDLPALWQQTIASVNITPQTTDPSQMNATIVVEDMTGELDFLETVNHIPVHLWMTDTNTATNPTGGRIDLFRGYALSPEGQRYRTDIGQAYPGQLATRWTLHCMGNWERGMRATIPRVQQWIDQASGLPLKVTDAVRSTLQSVYPPAQVSVPDNSTRLFGIDTNVTFPGVRVTDLTTDWIRDYFGGWILEDESAGTNGIMRGFFQRTPPYNNLAIFELDHPTILAGDSIPRIPQFAGSYPTTTSANSQKVQHIYMQGGTFRPKLESAEGNAVVVFGGGVNEAAQQSGGGDGAMFTQMAINVKSFNFLNLNPGDPGYPDGNDESFLGFNSPIRAFRYDLQDQASVNYMCRRIFDRTCFARYFLAFDAPMIKVTDVTDPLQQRPRKLRYYDPVQVRRQDGTLAQFLVVSCAPSYKKDHIQMARYVLVTQANIDQKGVIPIQISDLVSILSVHARVIGADLKHSKAIQSQQLQGVHFNSEIMALPSPTSAPIQDLINTSPTFGKFYQMSNFSLIGGPDVMR